jgi:hypothetical protein
VSQDWFERTFGACPHGGIRPYCAQCVGDQLGAKREEKRREDEEEALRGREKALQGRVLSLEATVNGQSKALDSAYSYIRVLERRLRRRPRRQLLAGRRHA